MASVAEAPKLVAPNGGSLRVQSLARDLRPPTGGTHFGWLDSDGEPVSICIAEVSAVMRMGDRAMLTPGSSHPLAGKYVIAMKNGHQLTITDEGFLRLLQKLGWKTE